jgi:hypothetical protein
MAQKTIVLDDVEFDLLQELFQEKIDNRFFSVSEWQTLNRIYEKFGIPPAADINTDFIAKYTNCFRGCETL